jgi:hypothetical protein
VGINLRESQQLYFQVCQQLYFQVCQQLYFQVYRVLALLLPLLSLPPPLLLPRQNTPPRAPQERTHKSVLRFQRKPNKAAQVLHAAKDKLWTWLTDTGDDDGDDPRSGAASVGAG